MQLEPFVLGITGGIGCGKSTVGQMMRDMGVDVLDADDVAHAVIEPDGRAYSAVVDRFGREILDSTGHIDRGRLAGIVFRDPEKLAMLNDLIHPYVRDAWRSWVSERRRQGRAAAVIIPLLFEIGEVEIWDAIVCIRAPLEEVYARLAARGLAREDVEVRMAAQLPVAEKCRRADYVIDNSGDMSGLRGQVERILAEVSFRTRKQGARQQRGEEKT